MTRPVITALPAAPTRGEDPATFAAKANTFVAALPAYGTESNALGVFMENEADAAQASRIAAEAAETGAEAAETAAQAAQAAAEAASNATEWVSGQAYVEGDVVWSPINYLSYRANTNTSGTTDPSLSASWTSLGVPLPVSVANGGTGLTALGTAGQVLTVNPGATALQYAGIPSGGFSNLTVLTSGTSYTVPAGVTKIKVTVTGGGGGGGGVAATGSYGAGTYITGGSGSAAATAIKIFTVTPGSVLSYAIGSGGAGGAAGNNPGGTGGNSTFTVGATTVTAGGGGAGSDNFGNNAGQGGVATNGDINITGGDGARGSSTGNIGSIGNIFRVSKQGGSSFWGGGGEGVGQGTPSQNARAYGAGGGTSAFSSQNGGAGFQGVITIEF